VKGERRDLAFLGRCLMTDVRYQSLGNQQGRGTSYRLGLRACASSHETQANPE